MPAKVHLVKAMAFPVVIYGCESWAINKADHQRIDAFKLVLEKTLESSLDSIEINPKRSQPSYSLEGLELKLQYFSHLLCRADSLEKTLLLGKIEDERRRG